METRSCGVRHMCALTLLLVSVCPLCCRASWMWLGVASAGLPEKLGCANLPLSHRQRDLCRRKPHLLPSIQDGARLAIAECHSQFRHERWNCSTRDEPQVFGYELTSGTRETAFIYAVMAAGLVHAVTRSCSQGNLTECSCDGRLQSSVSPTDGWHWSGCSDHIQYGTWFSRRFIDNTKNISTSRGGYTAAAMNQHNSEAGRQAVHRKMNIHCRCHGISGSCALKTCWKTMAPFEHVGVYLKEQYERSVQVSDRSRRKTRRKNPRRVPVDKHQLIFFNWSPNYCLEDQQRGIIGTRGRHCNRTSTGSDGCTLLCCGRGYNTHVVRHVERCECKFVWCCYVRCRRCESMNDVHTCK
ncbi:protein Wnt-16 [Chaetodon auriga]|uniref:protein Wnt-16 n=1 Tax=Chaetodon auriga TaxID=39042 RepID=UPI004032D97F